MYSSHEYMNYRQGSFQSVFFSIVVLIAVALAIDTIPIFALLFSVAWAVIAPFVICRLGRIFLPTAVFYSAFFLWVGICNYFDDMRKIEIETANKANDIFAQIDLAASTPFYSNGWIVGSVAVLLLIGMLVAFMWPTRLYRRLL